MTDPIDPVRPTRGDRRQTARRMTDPSPKAAAVTAEDPAALPVPLPSQPQVDPKPLLSAHLMGQDGQKRGLRGGPPTLAKAKAAYLNAEWSGPTDRRTRTGIISRTKI
jgi:hypothetical protein